MQLSYQFSYCFCKCSKFKQSFSGISPGTPLFLHPYSTILSAFMCRRAPGSWFYWADFSPYHVLPRVIHFSSVYAFQLKTHDLTKPVSAGVWPSRFTPAWDSHWGPFPQEGAGPSHAWAVKPVLSCAWRHLLSSGCAGHDVVVEMVFAFGISDFSSQLPLAALHLMDRIPSRLLPQLLTSPAFPYLFSLPKEII